MRRVAQYLALTLLILVVVALPAEAGLGAPISNEEQRVNGHGFRFSADQFSPDVSANLIVWQDLRGTNAASEGNAVWSKNLSTRDESIVTTLSTPDAQPRVSGDRVVWTDLRNSDNNDIFVRQMPGGSDVRLTTDLSVQRKPDIDGTNVVWEDQRNSNYDIFKKDLSGGSETSVVVAPGNQGSPSVSGATVAWRDSRDGPDQADVYVRVGSNPETKIRDVTGTVSSISENTVAVSGTRLIWNEVDPACGVGACDRPRILMTCVGLVPCATPTVVDIIDPGFGGSTGGLDISGSRAVWRKSEAITPGPDQQEVVRVYTKDLATGSSPVPVDAADPDELIFSSARIDGTRVVWDQQDDAPPGLFVGQLGTDILWKDLLIGDPPRRANSIGMGHFGVHLDPYADGPLVSYRAVGGGLFKVWATNLSGERRHREVSTFLGSDNSRPAVVGNRVAWSDGRNCPLGCPTGGDVIQRNPYDVGNEVHLSLPNESGNPPDVDGPTTVWNCIGDICVHNGSSPTSHDLSGDLLAPTSTVGSIVRFSTPTVVWHEAILDENFDATDARIHALNILTDDDEIISDGVEMSDEFAGNFDIDGTTVVWTTAPWAPSPALRRIDVIGCGGGGSTCDHSASSTVFEDPTAYPNYPEVIHELQHPSIDGGRVAWVDVDTSQFTNDIYTRTLSNPDRQLVTNSVPNAQVESPFVDSATNRIYWNDSRNKAGDIFMESVFATATLPAPDTTPPAQPTDFTATLGSSVDLTWNNPPDVDFYKVRILRKSGLVPPSGIDDASASVIYEGADESFTDTDVVDGVRYTYAAFAFDLEPNFSEPALTATAKRFVPLPPARVLDTRDGTGTCTPSPCAAVAPGTSIEVQITGKGGVPGANVDGVILNATVVSPASAGFLTVFPKGDALPVVSNLNFIPGDVRANLASLKVGADGRVMAYNGSSTTLNVVFDVAGYYSDGTVQVVGGSFQALTPARLLDTRDGTGQPSAGAIPAGGTVTLTVTNVGGVPASGVGAAVLNMTVDQPGADGFLTVYPQGTARPLASNVNFVAGQTIPNLAVVKLSTQGRVSIFNGSSGPVHVISDVSGIFSTATATFDGGGHEALSPVRILDTRSGIGGFSTPIPANSEITVQVLNVGGVPAADVQAVVLNVTVDQPQAAGYLTVYPSGVSQPTASNLNFTPGRPVPNLVMVKHGGGSVKVFNGSGGTVHVIFDVSGWFAPVLIL